MGVTILDKQNIYLCPVQHQFTHLFYALVILRIGLYKYTMYQSKEYVIKRYKHDLSVDILKKFEHVCQHNDWMEERSYLHI